MLLPFFEWCEATAVGHAIRSSLWLFPVIEAVHLLALAMMGGALLIVDLRLCGLGLGNHPVRQLAREAQPWLLGALAVMIATGTALFLSESIKCYYNTSFWVKMTALPMAIVFTFTVRRKITMTDDARVGRAWQRVVGIVSVALWITVAAAGRWIGFS